MSVPLPNDRSIPVWGTLPTIRWAVLLTLLLGELIALTLWIDTQSLAEDGRAWVMVVEHSHHVAAVAIAIATAVLLLGGTRVREELLRVSDEGLNSSRIWPWGLANVATFVVFGGLSSLITGSASQTLTHPALWVIAWVLTGTFVLACWTAAVVRPGLWLRLARRIAGPLSAGCAVGVAAWGAGQFTARLWSPLALWTLQVVQVLLGLVSRDVLVSPDRFEVGIGTFSITIAPECSGYEGVGLLWVFLAVYFWFCRFDLKFPNALLLVPIATAVVWLANAIRIAALVILGAWVSPELASGGFHSQAGWLAFNAIALGIVVMTRRLPWFASSRSQVVQEGTDNPAAEYLAPLIALVATTMIGTALTVGVDTTYPLRVLVTAGVLWYYRGRYATMSWSLSWEAVAIGVATFLLWIALEPAPTDAASELAATLTRWPVPWAAAWLAMRVVGSVITVPLAEELAFRGFLTRRLISTEFHTVTPGRFTWTSLLISSALFGALHGRWLAGTLAGMLFALAYYRRGRISDSILAHTVANALIAVTVLTTKSWSLWT